MFFFKAPIISRIEKAEGDENQSIKNNQTEYSKRWVYTINENNNTLLRIGNKGMSFEEFNRRKKLANLFPNQASDSIKNIYNKIKNDNKSGMVIFCSIERLSKVLRLAVALALPNTLLWA